MSVLTTNSQLSDKLYQIDKTDALLSDKLFQINSWVSNLFKFKLFSLSLSLSQIIKFLVFLSVLFLLIGCGGGGGNSESSPTNMVNAQTPIIAVQPISASYTKDATATALSVSANVNDAGTISYQWYSNTVNSNENGVLIPNETSSTYTPSTSNEGTTYYYVVVTNTNNNVNGDKTAFVKSDTVEIIVNALLSYAVNCFDENLDLESTIDVIAGDINPSDTNICGNKDWYLTSSDTAVTSHSLNGDINFYAVANVTEITDQTGFDNIRNNLSGKYILLNDIDLDETGAGFDTTAGWSPIGSGSNIFFSGILNGNNHKIVNLWINLPSNTNVGLFGYATNATIRNLGVETADNKEVKGKTYTGSIVGYCSGSSIANSYAKGKVRGNQRIGGITAIISAGSAITDSYAAVDIVSTYAGSYAYAGGIAGQVTKSAITNSYSAGTVSATGYAGGFVGYSSGGNITNSYATGDVKDVIGSSVGVGGFVGGTSVSNITNNYAVGSVYGKTSVGGIAGEVRGTIVQNNAAINPSVSGETGVSRVVGAISDSGIYISTISDNFALDSMSITGSTGYDAGTDKSGTELTTQSTYETLGWSFGDDDDNPWKIDADKNNGLPYLYWQEL
jgi:hypothetical protein